ncbi:hypothetical protein MTR_7g068760 [Medicago truncatula]|uniref:Uncharacterized protein n=1 Tax=Medicago truncatula TaxID=3880 RepID=A0A072U1X5_MEDTR|nr:hypothetical protein MTR_7g068760 [Medicago truncatula]
MVRENFELKNLFRENKNKANIFRRFKNIFNPLNDVRFLDGRTNVERGKGEAELKERVVQEHRGISSKRQVIPSRTDYNKLETLIETDGKLSALFACKAFTYLGERFCNLRLVTLNTHSVKD